MGRTGEKSQYLVLTQIISCLLFVRKSLLKTQTCKHTCKNTHQYFTKVEYILSVFTVYARVAACED